MNVFDLFAKISLDTKGYEQDLKGAQSSFSKFGDGLKSAASKIGDVLAGIGKTAAAGIGAAGTALTALTKQSLDAVANYEQLVGGVDKIFGESSKKVQEYANQAFKTAGLSANQYMETVTGFSASLLQSLDGDTEAAADAANRAIIDMSDNVNTYGSSMESVMNAYQGFSKANYTMLDNLKLGYGGTKEEMQRLIQDASQMNQEMQKLGVTVDADSMSFGNIVNAISVMQERMKIAGTTQNEAARTISGSIASMKAAWQNFITGTGSPAQFSEVLKASIGNIKNNLDDIIPRLTEGLTELADQIAPEIPAIIEQTLPSIISGASSLVTGLAERLPQLIPAIVPAVAQGIVNVSTAIVKIFPKLISSLKDAGKATVKALFPDKLDTQSIAEITKGAAATVSQFAVAVTNPKNVQTIVSKGDEIINTLIDGLLSEESISAFFEAAPQVIANLVDGIKTALLGSEQDGEGGIFGAAKKIVETLGDYFSDEKNRQAFWDAAYKALKSLASGVKSILEQGVAPLMVEIARAWAECFIGEIDYTDTAREILGRLGNAFAENLATGGIIGDLLEDVFYDTNGTVKNNERYNNSTFGGMLDEYNALTEAQKRTYDPGYTAPAKSYSGIPRNLAEEYAARYGGKHATGFYARRPAFLSGDWVGENGDEVLLPLDRNDGWADKLAAKIGGGGVHVENINVSVQFAESGDDATVKRVVNSMIGEISEQLADLQGRESRGLGLGYRGGTWA